MENKKVELIARFPKKKSLTEEDKNYIAAQKIIAPDLEINLEDEIEYDYDYIIIDLKDISDIIKYDEEHTQIIKYSGMLYILKIPYETFKEIYGSTLGVIIYTT